MVCKRPMVNNVKGEPLFGAKGGKGGLGKGSLKSINCSSTISQLYEGDENNLGKVLHYSIIPSKAKE